MHTLTRADARKQGLARFYTGTPCAQGHSEGRYVSNRRCNHIAKRTKRRANGLSPGEKLGRLRRHRRLAGLPEPTRASPTHCECCGRAVPRTLHLDHCHSTGAFRGWICSACNVGIGHLGDTLTGVRRAVAYLERTDPFGDLLK